MCICACFVYRDREHCWHECRGLYQISHSGMFGSNFFLKLFCEWSRLLINVGFCVLWPCWNDAFCTFVLLINMNDALKTDQQLARSELELWLVRMCTWLQCMLSGLYANRDSTSKDFLEAHPHRLVCHWLPPPRQVLLVLLLHHMEPHFCQWCHRSHTTKLSCITSCNRWVLSGSAWLHSLHWWIQAKARSVVELVIYTAWYMG